MYSQKSNTFYSLEEEKARSKILAALSQELEKITDSPVLSESLESDLICSAEKWRTESCTILTEDNCKYKFELKVTWQCLALVDSCQYEISNIIKM